MKTRHVLAMMLGALLLVSCQPAILDQPAGAQVTSPALDPDKAGTVRVSVPALSPVLAKALGIAQPTSASPAVGRAILIATKVVFTLSLAGQVVESWEEYVSIAMGGGSQMVTSHDVYAASGYTLHAEVYNSAAPSTGLVVSGTSSAFDVIAGQTTSVSIVCIPCAPDVLPYPAGLARTLQSGVYNASNPNASTWGGERWFKIVPAGETAMELTVTPDETSVAVGGVYNSQGYWKSMFVGGFLNGPTPPGGPVLTPGAPAKCVFACPAGDTAYYVGVLTLGETSHQSTVTLTYAPVAYVDPQNHTRSSAVALSMTGPTSGRGVTQAFRGNVNNPSGGDWYTFTLGPGDVQHVIVRLEFVHASCDYNLSLYDANGTWIKDSMSSLYGTDYEQIELDLAMAQTYFIWVWGANSMPPNGTPYTLQWPGGQGTIDVSIQ
jgi:hypothetical protein